MELFLSEENISKERWLSFLLQIHKLQGFLRKWQIEIEFERNKIHYYLETSSLLPPILSGFPEFVFKQCEKRSQKRERRKIPTYLGIGKSSHEIFDFLKVKKRKQLYRIRIRFLPIYQTTFITSIFLFFQKKNKSYRQRLLFTTAASTLASPSKSEQRFFYQKLPKYLNLQKSIHLFSKNPKTPLLEIEPFPYSSSNYYLNMKDFSFNKHSMIVGSSGTGKSKFISYFIEQIQAYQGEDSQYKVMIIDPHASLEKDLNWLNDTEVINFQTDETGIDLFLNDTEDFVATTELLLSLFKNLLSSQYNSKLERVLRYAILLLLYGHQFTFSNLRKLLLELEFRNSLLQELEEILPVQVVEFFLTDFTELKSKSYNEAISPIISFIDEMQLVPIFQEENQTNSLESLLERNFLTIFSLDRTKLGDKITKTIASLLMQQVLGVIQTKKFTEHLILIVDEVAVVENPILERLLSEARKYGLSIILAGQYFNQISDNLKNAIFANVVNYFSFRISRLDAVLLSDMLEMELMKDNTKEKKIQILTELADRECIARIQNNGTLIPAFLGKTMDFQRKEKKKKEENSSHLIEHLSISSFLKEMDLMKTILIRIVR